MFIKVDYEEEDYVGFYFYTPLGITNHLSFIVIIIVNLSPLLFFPVSEQIVLLRRGLSPAGIIFI